MNAHLLACLAFGSLAASSLLAQSPVVLDVTGNAAEHQLTWTTELGFNYHIFVSTDLENWTDTGIVEPGCGSPVGYRIAPDPPEPQLYYQIWASAGSAFLLLPCQWEEAALTDGVCFAFDLNTLMTDPERVLIWKRDYGSNDPFDLIGALTDFAEIDNIKFLRGSAVWVPDQTDLGEFEFLIEAVDDLGGIIEEVTRHVRVSPNLPPAITIDGVLNVPGESPLTVEGQIAPRFSTTVSDPDVLGHPAFRTDDVIRRVEFFANGVHIGTDFTEPFGDQLRDITGAQFFDLLFRGIHEITARVYDSRGGVGETSLPFIINVTPLQGQTLNARPSLTITSPPNGTDLVQGEDLLITVSVSDLDGEGDINGVDAVDMMMGGQSGNDLEAPFTEIELNTTTWLPGIHTVEVTATDKSGHSSDDSFPRYLQVRIVDPDDATFAADLVEVITDPGSADPSEADFSGLEISSDEFSDGVISGLDLDEGILLTTGQFQIWNGRDDGEEEETIWDLVGDRGLEDRIAGTFTRDGAVLEFDVECEDSQLEFRVQFGSEEYLEWVDNPLEFGCKNDAFIITVDGVVVSQLPDCSNIVAVSTIHPSTSWLLPSYCLLPGEVLAPKNEHLYLSDSEIDARVQAINPANQPIQVEYDGMCIALRFHAFVTPGEHHVRIVIADVDDERHDSGLFIEAGSVRTIQPEP